MRAGSGMTRGVRFVGGCAVVMMRAMAWSSCSCFRAWCRPSHITSRGCRRAPPFGAVAIRAVEERKQYHSHAIYIYLYGMMLTKELSQQSPPYIRTKIFVTLIRAAISAYLAPVPTGSKTSYAQSNIVFQSNQSLPYIPRLINNFINLKVKMLPRVVAAYMYNPGVRPPMIRHSTYAF